MAQASPYMIARTIQPSGICYDILEGQWLCTDIADATYYCIHNWYDATGTFRGIVDGSGYAGFQWKNHSPWTIMSVWANEHGKPAIEYAPPGSIAEPFCGEGTGVHVLVPYPWRQGRWYTMRVQARTDAGKTFYEQWIRQEDQAWCLLAVISYPRPGLGFTWDCFFLEDWAGNDLLRSCRLRGYYARRRDMSWQSLDRYCFYNHRGALDNTATDCGFGRAGDDTVWIASGGGYSLTLPQMPHEISVAQLQRPSSPEMLV